MMHYEPGYFLKNEVKTNIIHNLQLIQEFRKCIKPEHISVLSIMRPVCSVKKCTVHKQFGHILCIFHLVKIMTAAFMELNGAASYLYMYEYLNDYIKLNYKSLSPIIDKHEREFIQSKR
jgi:hypothetical protein